MSSNDLVSMCSASCVGLPTMRDHFSYGELFFSVSTFAQLTISRMSSLPVRSAVTGVDWSLVMRNVNLSTNGSLYSASVMVSLPQ